MLTYPDGRTVAYSYDDMDRLTGVKGLDGTKTTYTYDAAGQRTETKTGTLTTTYAYDSVGNLTKQETAGKTKLTLDYLYDLNNRMTGETRTESGATVKSTYVYDKLGQLTGFDKSDGYSEAYAYDSVGNMLQKTVNKQKLAMTYDAANELKTITGTGGKIDYSYDANGNLTQKTMAAYTDTYAYNVKNQLTSYKGYDGYQQRYTYNAQGHMVKRESKGSASRQTLESIATGEGESNAATSKDGGSDDDPDPYANAGSSDVWSTTTYVYDVTAPYYEVLSETTNGATTAYDYGVERLSAYSGNAWNTQKTDYVYDGRGSVAQELTYNSSWYTLGGALAQKTVDSYSYTPFGELLTGEGSGFRFNGEYYDSATGMLNLRARQYEPAVMRFVQRDLLKGDQSAPLSLNRYLYCENDSVNFVDPSGKSLTSLWNKAKAAVSTAVKKVTTSKVVQASATTTKTVQANATTVSAPKKTLVSTIASAVKSGIVNTAKTIATAATTIAANVKTTVSNTRTQALDWYGRNEETINKCLTTAAVVLGTAAFVVLAVASAGTVAAAAGVMFAGTALAGSASTLATIGVYGLATVAGLFGASNVGEVWTGKNVVRDTVFGGNQTVYDVAQVGVAALSMGVSSFASYNSGLLRSAPTVDNPADEVGAGSAGEYAGKQAAGAAQSESAGTTACSEAGSTSTTRVGRWMSIDEYNAMQKTGKVQMSPEGNTTYIANPADPNAFKGAPTGSVYVEFDVPTNSVKPAGNSMWGQIPGPGSNLDKYEQILKGAQPIIEMPDAMNIQLLGGK